MQCQNHFLHQLILNPLLLQAHTVAEAGSPATALRILAVLGLEGDLEARLGTLSHDRGTLRFVYEPAWLKNPQIFRPARSPRSEGCGSRPS